MIKLLFLLFLFDKIYLQEFDKENDVFLLNEDNFDEIIAVNKPVLVNFYAPWCQYSKKLQPHFERVAQDFVAQNVSLKLGKVDIVMEEELAKRFNIKKYPTLILFKEDRTILYNKSHNYVIISNWLLSKTDNLILKINRRSEYENLLNKYDILLMIDESKYTNIFYLAAEKVDDIQFIVINSKLYNSLFSRYNDISMIIRRKVDLEEIPFYGIISEESINKFALSNEVPPVVIHSKENGGKIFSNPYKLQHFLVFASENLESIELELKKASKHHNEIQFAIINVSLNITENIINFFKVDVEKVPYMILSDTERKKTFKPAFSEIDGDKIDNFITEVKNGKVEEFLRSQSVPEDWDSGAVKVLVGKNFEKVAFDKSKHVFVEFYAPWCSHCKQLAPIWERFAQSLANVPDLIIAKLDKTENDIRNIEITSFPTLKLFLKDSNEMISYSGLRTKDALLEFISKYTEIKIDEKKEL